MLVEDEYQGRGLGPRLIGHLVDRLPADAPLAADALTERRRALRLLARFGSLRVTPSAGVLHAAVTRSPGGPSAQRG